MKAVVGLAIAVPLLAVLIAVAPSAPQPASAQALVDASQVCFAHHKFGAQPVDVAKTPDGSVVLARIAWNWHDSIGCFLTLDEGATAVLRQAPPPVSLPIGKTAASQLYSEWSNERQSEWVADNQKRADWMGSTTDMGAFQLDRHHEDFINDAVDYADVVFKVWNPDGSDWGLVAFSLRNAYTVK